MYVKDLRASPTKDRPPTRLAKMCNKLMLATTQISLPFNNKIKNAEVYDS